MINLRIKPSVVVLCYGAKHAEQARTKVLLEVLQNLCLYLGRATASSLFRLAWLSEPRRCGNLDPATSCDAFTKIICTVLARHICEEFAVLTCTTSLLLS